MQSATLIVKTTGPELKHLHKHKGFKNQNISNPRETLQHLLQSRQLFAKEVDDNCAEHKAGKHRKQSCNTWKKKKNFLLTDTVWQSKISTSVRNFQELEWAKIICIHI